MLTTETTGAVKRPDIFSMALSQQIVIWAIRHVTHYGESAIRAGMSKVVGEAETAQAIRTFAFLSRQISAHKQSQSAIAEPWSITLSTLEQDLLRLIALAQHGVGIELSVAQLPWVYPEQWEATGRSLKQTAHVLQKAGKVLPLQDSQNDTNSSPLFPATVSSHDLTGTEATLLVAIRVWVKAAINREPTTPPTSEYLMLRQLGSLVQPICAILRNTAANAIRLLDIHCPQCKSLSIDEARLLNAIGRAQHNQRFVVEKMVATWLESPHKHALAMDTHELAQRLTQLDLTLPLRDWQFPEVHGGASSWPLEDERVAHTVH